MSEWRIERCTLIIKQRLFEKLRPTPSMQRMQCIKTDKCIRLYEPLLFFCSVKQCTGHITNANARKKQNPIWRQDNGNYLHNWHEKYIRTVYGNTSYCVSFDIRRGKKSRKKWLSLFAIFSFHSVHNEKHFCSCRMHTARCVNMWRCLAVHSFSRLSVQFKNHSFTYFSSAEKLFLSFDCRTKWRIITSMFILSFNWNFIKFQKKWHQNTIAQLLQMNWNFSIKILPSVWDWKTQYKHIFVCSIELSAGSFIIN